MAMHRASHRGQPSRRVEEHGSGALLIRMVPLDAASTAALSGG